jgi:sec-independent protein translocase protein TatC
MSLGDHLEELRARLILALLGLGVTTVVCLIFGTYIIRFLEEPYFKAMKEQSRLLISLSPTDGFTCYMTIGLVTGVILASPWIFYQAWQFVAAGLYAKERRYVYLAMPFSTVLFVLGALLFIFCIATPTLSFLVNFNRDIMKVDSVFTFSEYVSFMALTTLVFGLAFQTPIVVFVLHKIGLVSLAKLKSSRKYIFFGVVVVAAAAIPGSDVVSLIGLVVCMYGLFEFGVVLCWYSDRKKQKAAAAQTGVSPSQET